MKVFVIMGSPRRGNTFQACEELKSFMNQSRPVDFEYMWLKDADIRPCNGCLNCFPQGEMKCPHRDDVQKIIQKMMEADGVIFTSPVYSGNVSGLMKTFFDRISYLGHRPRFFGKRALVLATTGGIGAKEALEYMSTMAGTWWGFEIVRKVGLVTSGTMSLHRAEKNERLLRRAAKDFMSALSDNRFGRPGFMDVCAFHVRRGIISQVEAESPADYLYWKENGWLSPGAKYYVDVSVNPIYRALGMIFELMQVKRIRKERSSQRSSPAYHHQ